MTNDADGATSPLEWDEAGQPRSRRFGDIYFSRQDGLAESRAVFLQGCGLPQAWVGRRAFTVAELGFGTGLNIAALLDLWRREGPPDGHLHICSIEAFPLSRAEAARALSAWPDIADASAALLDAWPEQARGWRRVDLRDWRATLDLAVDEAADALADWDGHADAWFLDGFAPAANPQMWRPEVLQLVAQRSAPGARIATFTVAGAVRRGLQAQGLAVDKRPGFGRKRERLEVRAPGDQPAEAEPGRVAILGGGIAGAAVARALAALGVRATVYDAGAAAPGASGNPAALVSPRLDAGGGPVAQLSAQAFVRAAALYRATAGVILAEGALQLEGAPRDARRFDNLAEDETYRDCRLQRLPASQAALRLGEACATGGLWMTEALVVSPRHLLDAWLGLADRVERTVAAVAQDDDGWRLLDGDGGVLGQADHVVVCAGASAARFADMPLQAVRGQVSWTAAETPPVPAAWGGYAIPLPDGVLFGATHDRDDRDIAIRAEDHMRNLEQLAQRRPMLASAIDPQTIRGRAGLRAASPDRLPIAGPLSGKAGWFVLGALGGRGFTFAPLLAEHVAAQVVGAPSPLPVGLQAIVSPGRFLARQQRRGSAG